MKGKQSLTEIAIHFAIYSTILGLVLVSKCLENSAWVTK